jgi:hypothetical protein
VTEQKPQKMTKFSNQRGPPCMPVKASENMKLNTIDGSEMTANGVVVVFSDEQRGRPINRGH